MEAPDDVRSAGAASGANLTGSTDNDRTTEDVQQLKAEISETQAELQQTVAEIQERLSPTHLKEQATGAVRDATIGRMQNMMNRAGDTIGQAADTTRSAARSMTAGVRSNPVPYALIAIGTAWLIASNRSSRRWSSDDEWTEGAGWGSGSDAYEPVGSTSEYATPSSEYATSSYSASSEYASSGLGAGGYASGDVSGAGWDNASRRRTSARERARNVATQARNRWDSMLQDNPMVLGIAALAAGALVGAAFPSTDVESRYLGEARENVLESAREMAQSTVQKATT